MILLSLLLSLAAQADPLMHFSYEPAEDASTSCTHQQIRDLPDYAVTCATPYGTKTFTAHVIVRQAPRGNDTGAELLYWVTEPGDTETSPRKYHSTTALFHLKGSTSLTDFSLSQGVENDQASLVLGWRNP